MHDIKEDAVIFKSTEAQPNSKKTNFADGDINNICSELLINNPNTEEKELTTLLIQKLNIKR